MSEKKTGWIRRLLVAAALTVTVVVTGGFAFKNYATPVQRANIEQPLYTVGDANYAVALNKGKNILKFGRLPFGVYPGGLAFSDPQDAWEHLRSIGKDQEWGVYQLTGDFELDTKLVDDQRYTTVSLAVIGVVEPGVR
jgi:hypothetical protein